MLSPKILSRSYSARKHNLNLQTCGFRTRRNEFGRYFVVMPERVTDKLHVPRFITFPPYASKLARRDKVPLEPEIKDEKDILKMRKSCLLARRVLDAVAKQLKVGITTDELDKMVHKMCIDNNAYPSPLGYNGFPKSICTSVNNVACHGIPDRRPLKNGDIINVDVSVFLNGFHGDCCDTYAVGDVDAKGLDLIRATKKCLQKAISICRDGQQFRKIGEVINDTAIELGYNVLPCFAGHGIGNYFHGPPDILHCDNDYPGEMRAGMTFTIEPVLTQGEPEVVILQDGWTAITVDNARAAQAEHTILVHENSAEILTRSDEYEDEESSYEDADEDEAEGDASGGDTSRKDEGSEKKEDETGSGSNRKEDGEGEASPKDGGSGRGRKEPDKRGDASRRSGDSPETNRNDAKSG